MTLKSVSMMLALAGSLFISLSGWANQGTAQEGQLAPDFSIRLFDGGDFTLSDYRGKQPVYLIFWNTWCGYCIKKVPATKQHQAALSGQLKIVAINTSLSDSVEATLAFRDKHQLNYPLAFDHGKIVTDLYGVYGTPTEFIIDINGVIRHRDGIPHNLSAQLPRWRQRL